MSDLSQNPANASEVLRPLTALSVASYTRPADTTTYAVGDVVADSTSAATILTFTGMAREAGGGGVLQNAVMIDSIAATVKAYFELVLLDTAPTMQNDNAAWAPSDAELRKVVAVIAFDGTAANAFKSTSNGGFVASAAQSLSYKCAAGSTSLYGIVVARNAYVPASAEVFDFRLAAILD